MNTTTSLQDFPADIRDAVAAFAHTFVRSIDSADDITAETVGAELERQFNTVAGFGNVAGNRVVEYAVQRLAGTYDEFRAGSAA